MCIYHLNVIKYLSINVIDRVETYKKCIWLLFFCKDKRYQPELIDDYSINSSSNCDYYISPLALLFHSLFLFSLFSINLFLSTHISICFVLSAICYSTKKSNCRIQLRARTQIHASIRFESHYFEPTFLTLTV